LHVTSLTAWDFDWLALEWIYREREWTAHMTQTAMPPEMLALCDPFNRFKVAWEIAHEAASFLLNDRPADLSYTYKSTSSDLVSYMDKKSEEMIVQHIFSNFPQDGVLGEEGANRSGSNNIRWIIDPLDGTVNYLFGIPLWGVSIGIEINGSVDYGIVVIPAQGETYVAQRGLGAFRMSGGNTRNFLVERIHVRESVSLDRALVTTGFGYSPSRRVRQAEVITEIIPCIADIRRGGAAVVDLCWFASGRSDAYFEYGLNPWDYAAGALIAQEAGGIVQGLATSDFSEFLVAATPKIFSEFRALLVDKGARKIFESSL